MFVTYLPSLSHFLKKNIYVALLRNDSVAIKHPYIDEKHSTCFFVIIQI